MGRRISIAGTGLLVLVPGVLVVSFSFVAGGFFPDAVAAGAILLGLALVLRLTLAERPLAGLTIPYVVVAGVLTLFAIWTLISSTWSDAPGRALIEYDRVLLYLLAFILVGALGRTTVRLRWAVRAVALAAAVVCACAFISRAMPDVWSVAPSKFNERLGFPLTYPNALGLLAAIGCVLCGALTTDLREARAGRVLASLALPLLAATLLLTFSRGALAALVAGAVIVVVVGRPAALVSGGLAATVPVFIAVRATYRADLLAMENPTTAAATAQGHDLAVTVVLCMLGAGLVRALCLALDARVARISVPKRWQRRELRVAAAIAPALVVLVAAVALGLPGEASSRYHAFVNERSADPGDVVRDRLFASGNNGRVQLWEVAIDAFRDERLHGQGAGTFALRWERDRKEALQSEDAHSLYLEVLGELGIVGMGLLGIALVMILGGFARIARGPDRVVGAALLAAAVTWTLQVGVDWLWEMPAVTAWVFAAGGLALGAAQRVPARAAASGDPPPRDSATTSRRPPSHHLTRIVAGLGVLGVLLVPLSVYRSQGALVDAARAFKRGDCSTAVDNALASRDALSARPEPYVLIGYCDVRLGHPRLGILALERAVRLDPNNWEMHYGLALVRGAAGLDPRSQARDAARLNPSEEDLAAPLVRTFDTEDPRAWRRRALRAPLPVS